MSATCDSCRWWKRTDFDGPEDEEYQPIEPGRWGRCSFILDSDGVCGEGRTEPRPHSARAYPADASGYSAWLVVRADFGCIEHDPASLRGQG